jgi:hypothetical protein
MSRGDSDQDYSDDNHGPYSRFNDRCRDCGDPIDVRPLEPPYCARCLFDRDTWLITYKERMAKLAAVDVLPTVPPLSDPEGRALKTMAKAVLAADLTTITEVA